jgi:hypothetical protein
MQAAGTDTRAMKGLLALVIIMGVLIVVGLIVVVVTIANRLGGSSASIGFDTADLPIPGGCQVVETIPADDRLILRLGTGDRCSRLLIVDMASGRLLGTLRLVPERQE